MGKSNRVAYVAYNVGVISFAIMIIYAFISVMVIISMILEGDGDEALIYLPLLVGLLIGGLAETGICFVISEIVQLLDDANRHLSKCVNCLEKGHNRDSTEKLYNEELPEL